MNQNLKEIYSIYETLLPPRDEGIVIFWLDYKIKNNEIDTNFTYHDIKKAITETIKLETGTSPQTRRILKNLLHNFIEHPPEKPKRYKLTNHAEKFISLLENKINNRYKDFPLKESFNQYSTFKAEDIKFINQFELWFEQGFSNSAKQSIVDHLEALKDKVSSSIKELNRILYFNTENLVAQVEVFSAIFIELGGKADEITLTLQLGSNLEQEIKKTVDFFYGKIHNYKNPTNVQERKELEELKNDFEKASYIQKEVVVFFKVIDEKLGQVREKISYASTKLKELPEIFRYQSQFKINIRRFLEYILTKGHYSKKEPFLHRYFPLKIIPFENFKFINIPYIDFTIKPLNKVIEFYIDKKHEEKERMKIEQTLMRQGKIAKLVMHYKQILVEKKELDFTVHFYKILEEENNLEVPIQVGYELFQFASRSQEYEVKINQNLLNEIKSKHIITWQMDIKKV